MPKQKSICLKIKNCFYLHFILKTAQAGITTIVCFFLCIIQFYTKEENIQYSDYY